MCPFVLIFPLYFVNPPSSSSSSTSTPRAVEAVNCLWGDAWLHSPSIALCNVCVCVHIEYDTPPPPPPMMHPHLSSSSSMCACYTTMFAITICGHVSYAHRHLLASIIPIVTYPTKCRRPLLSLHTFASLLQCVFHVDQTQKHSILVYTLLWHTHTHKHLLSIDTHVKCHIVSACLP